MSLGQQATPTPLQVLYEANIYFCFVQTPLYEVLKIIKCSEIICDAKMTVGGNHVVFCPGYNSVLQARNCALELRLLGHFISRLFWCWRDTHCSLWTWGVILPTQAANRFPPPPPSLVSYCLKEIYSGLGFGRCILVLLVCLFVYKVE